MIVRQFFTPRGLLGAILFVVSPVFAGICYFFWFKKPPYDASNSLLYIGAFFSLLEMASIPMMLIGRVYEVDKPR